MNVKNALTLLIAFWLCLIQILFAQTPKAPKTDNLPDVNEILKHIQAPVFPNVVYDITHYGAIGDGKTDTKHILDSVIRLCTFNGGGTVLVPKGDYFVAGPIVLKNKVNLHIEEGATVTFTSDDKAYLPCVLTLFEGTELFNYSPLIYAYNVSDIAITGKGTINGNATANFAKMRPQFSGSQNKLRQMGIDGVPVYQRVFGEGQNLPPNMIEFFGCRNILVEGVKIVDAPFWIIHPAFCDNVTVRDVTVRSYNLNNDGCDPECSSNVLIERCNFYTGDDAIAIKAGRDQDAWRIGQPTENIVIRDCVFSSLCNGLCIGSEMAAGVRNIYMDNIKIGKCRSAMYFKSNTDRGGYIKNVHINHVTCDSVSIAFIRIESQYAYGARGGHHPALFDNFLIENSTCVNSLEAGVYAVGLEGFSQKHITLNNITITQAPIPHIIKYAEHITFNKVTINGLLMPANPPLQQGSIKLKE